MKTIYLVATNGIVAEFASLHAAEVFAENNGAYVAEYIVPENYEIK
jgi:hypothetical protein